MVCHGMEGHRIRGHKLKKLFLFFLISLICEVLQYILNIGASDITDIINNTLGNWINDI
jgi:glycopeptide antibiotics resistance protein